VLKERGEAGDRFPFFVEEPEMLSADAAHEMPTSSGAVTLAPLRASHAAALFPLLDDWEIVRMLARVPWPLALADVEAYAGRSSGPDAESDDFVILADGETVGAGNVKRPGSGDPPRRMPRLGYWIGRPHWGRGHATAAAGLLVGHAFARFPGDVVGAGVFEDNPGSRRVLEKLGFEAAGRYDTACLSRGGPVQTADMHLTRAVWAARRLRE
jgi:RimJ/RimL family protein N-acetyltransferase